MRHRALPVLLTCALLLAACSSKPSTSPGPVPAPQTPPAQSTQPAAPVVPAQAKSPLDDWNDKAFTAIKAQRWAEAEAAAREAIKLDAKNTAGWFNLGRALLGAGRADEAVSAFASAAGLSTAKNADIEYFLAQSLEASGRVAEAADRYQVALRDFPGDKEITAALEALKARYAPGPIPAWAGDFDGDGKPDRVQVAGGKVTVLGAAGQTLLVRTYAGQQGVGVTVDRMEDGTQLLHVTYPACASGPQNAFFWYDRKAGKVLGMEKDTPCMIIDHEHGSLFVGFFREPPFSRVVEMQWTPAGWTGEQTKQLSLLFDVSPAQLAYVLTTIANERSTFAQPTALFASPDLYQAFATKTQAGKWSFAAASDPLHLNVTLDGKPHGTLTLTYDKNRITVMVWSE